MRANPLSLLDRLSSRSTFIGSTGSICGIVGTLMFLATCIWMYYWLTHAYIAGSFFQSSYESQVSSNQKVKCPKDIKMSIQFINRTSKALANHTALMAFFNTRMFQNAFNGDSNYQITNRCDAKYFDDAINPTTLSDCYIFLQNRTFTYGFSANPSTGTFVPSYAGFQLTYTCYSPFTCGTTGVTQVALQRNLVSTFGNYSVIFYFSTKVLQADGTNRHQVNYVSLTQFNSPFTIAASVDVQLIFNNITMDYSIYPWRSFVSISNLAWYGLVRGTTRNATSLTTLPKFDIMSAPYQHFIYRYYVKFDRWMGYVCGGVFLVYLGFLFLCFHINQSKYRINAAQELLLQINQIQTDNGNTIQIFKTPKISINYYLFRFIPSFLYKNQPIQKSTEVLDISRILQRQRVSMRNLLFFLKKIEDKPLYIKFQEENQQPIQQNLLKEQQSKIKVGGLKQQSSELNLLHQDSNLLNTDSMPNLNQTNLEKNNQSKNQQNKQMQEKSESMYENKEEKVEQKAEQKKQQKKEEKVYEQIPVEGQENIIINNSQLHSSNQVIQIVQHNQIQQPLNINSQPDNQIMPINNQDLAQLFNLHPQALKAIKKSDNIKRLFPNFLTLMHLTDNKRIFDNLRQYESYDNTHVQQTSRLMRLFNNFIQFCKTNDCYNVKISFNAGVARSSFCGFFTTIFIIGFSSLICFSLLQNSNTYQTFISKDFLQPSQIKYTLTTGSSFRPALCFSHPALNLLDSNVTLQFYTYSNSKYTYYKPTNLQYGQNSMLGITPDNPYSKIDTSTCFVFPDGVKIQMGGYNTPHQAYFGFRIVGYCVGTPLYCSLIQNTTDTNLYSFLNAASNTFTFYAPINQYSPNLNTIYTGQVFPRLLREGSAKFNARSSVQETIYLDRSQLLDNYNKQFIGDAPKVIEETISSTRDQLATNIKYVNSSTAYYDFKARPSGYLTKVYLTGYTLYTIMGIIGGIVFGFRFLFAWMAQCYNDYNVRAKLAEELYNQNVYNYATFVKILYLVGGRLICCGKLGKKLRHMYLVDEKIKYDLNAIQTIKEVYTCSKLSTIHFQDQEERQLASIYFKEKANQPIVKDKSQKQKSEQHFGQQLLSQLQQLSSSYGPNKISNIVGAPEEPINPPEEQQQVNNQQPSQSNGGQGSQTNNELGKQDNEQIQPYQIYKGQQYYQKTTKYSWLYKLDLFRVAPEFSLKGKWRVGSMFGFIMTIITVLLIFLIYGYYLVLFDSNQNYLNSYERGMLVNPDTVPPLQLNTNSNFRAAFGFYNKPGMAFVDVSSLINTTINSSLSMSLYQASQVWNNSQLIIRQTKYDLIPCPADYFNGFMNPNDDPSYFSSLTNAFCLPYNISLNLSSDVIENMQFFKVSLYNTTVAGSSVLTTLTTTYPLGVYMTIPVIDLANKGFRYKVQQIRPNLQTLTRAYEVNITLTRQRIIYTTPNYTINQNSTSMETYYYIESRSYQRAMTAAPTTVARVYNITFSHSGYRQTYKMTYPNIPQLIGYAGGISFIIIFIIKFIAQSFNEYLKLYLIGKQLYLYVSYGKKKEKKHKKKVQQQSQLQQINNLNELSILWAWFLSFFAAILRSYNWNDTLEIVHTIQQKAQQDLDLCNFYKKHLLIKQTINKLYKLSSNQKIPVTSIYDKQIICQTNQHRYSEGSFKKQIKLHQLSSRSQWMLERCKHSRLKNVLQPDYMQKCLLINKYERRQQQINKFQSWQQPKEKMQKFDFVQYIDLANQSHQIPPESEQKMNQKKQQIEYNKKQFEKPIVNEPKKAQEEAEQNFDYMLQVQDRRWKGEENYNSEQFSSSND